MSYPRLALLGWLSLALSAGTFAAETLRIGADQWMPFNGEPETERPGYVVEVLRKVYAAEGIAVDYRVVPWADALEQAAKGELHGVIGANRTEAAKLRVPQEEVGAPRVALWVHKSNRWRYADLRSLLQVRVGVIAEYKYWDSFDEFVAKQPSLKLVKFSGEAPLRDALSKMLAGEIDVIPETLPVFTWNVKAAGLTVSDFTMAYLHPAEPIYVAFSPAHPRIEALVKAWDAGVRKLRASGELEQILQKYGLRDWRD